MTTPDENRERLAQLESRLHLHSTNTVEVIEKLERVLARVDAAHDSTRDRGENTEAAVQRLAKELGEVVGIVRELVGFITYVTKSHRDLQNAVIQEFRIQAKVVPPL